MSHRRGFLQASAAIGAAAAAGLPGTAIAATPRTGFHLAPANEACLAQVVAELKKFDIDHLIPMHCSGSNFQEAAKREMPEKPVLCTTGSRLTFGA